MENRWKRWNVLGREVWDGSGQCLGPVVDTYPWDGGEMEMVVVRLPGGFAERRMLRLEDLHDDGIVLHTPFARWQVEDSPALSAGRHAVEDSHRAKSYWRFEEPEKPLPQRRAVHI